MKVLLADRRVGAFSAVAMPSPAHGRRTHVKVEVVGVCCIVVRAENGPKPSACAVADCTEKRRLRVIAIPVANEAYFASIAEDKCCDVDRVGGRMLAAPTSCSAVHISTAVCAEMAHADDLCAEVLHRCRLKRVALEQCPGCSDATGDCGTTRRDPNATRKQNGVLNRTGCIGKSLWNAGERHARCGKGSEARLRFAGKSRDLDARHQPRLGPKIKWHARIPLGRKIPVGKNPDNDEEGDDEQWTHSADVALRLSVSTPGHEVLTTRQLPQRAWPVMRRKKG